jgi:arylsulfatase A-like enzyme/Flp pilus assembly protein TadD
MIPRSWPAAILLAGIAAACGQPSLPSADRVVLVTIDTLRADRVGVYGDARAETPTLDALAVTGVRFDQAIAPTPITRPSHTSILTGLDPPSHAVRGNSVFSLEAGIPTVAEHFSQAGFATAAFVAAFVLDSRFGLDRGFDVYDDDVVQRRASGSPFSYAERRGDAVVDAALAWLRDAPEHFFLWVHLYDPHANYDPPPPFAARFSDDPYAGEIAFADAQLGRLLAGIRRRFGLEGLAVVVTSDHGESLGDHGEATHSLTVYDATQRVPLILHAPGLPRGRRVDAQVRSMDLAPTLLELAGAPPLPDIAGRSLLPLALGRAPQEERIAYLEAIEPQLSMGWSPVLGVRSGGLKYLRAPRPELYDLASDPGELRNLAPEHPERVAELDAEVEAIASLARTPSTHATFDSEDRARLESLGYLMPEDDAIESLSIGVVAGPDPKDHMQEASAMQRAGSLIAEGLPERALVLLAAIERPGRQILLMRANAATQIGRHDAALEAGRQLVALDPAKPEHHYVVGIGLLSLERVDEAEQAFEEALALDPQRSSALVGLALVARAREEPERALALLRRADALEEPPAGARLQLGLALLAVGEPAEAHAAFASLTPAFAEQSETQIYIANAEWRSGKKEEALARLRAAAHGEPRARRVLASLAELLQWAGRSEEAVATWRRAYALDPGDPGGQNDLAWGLAVAGQSLDEALRLARGAATGLGETPEALDTLATVHLARGEAQACLTIVERGLPEAQGKLRSHLRYLQAAALDALGRPDDARAALVQAAEGLDPPFDTQADALARRLGLAPLTPDAS